MDGLILPNHIAVILDGNRRWARENGLKPWEGHKHGSEKFEKFLEWCLDLNIQQISAYVLSTENLNRPKREVLEILRLLKIQLDKFETEKAGLLDKYEVKVRFCGDLSRLPPDLVNVMKRIMKKTEKYNKKVLNMLIAYGGRFELTEMIKRIVNTAIKSGRIQITQKTIKENLLISGDVDLLIRTGGEFRLSNFMPWQTTYSELIVLKKYWPDFTKNDLIWCIKEYNRRQRRFGK